MATSDAPLNVPNVTLAVARGASLPPVDPNPVGTIVSDGFETAEMGATRENGFEWGSNNRTSLVTMDPTDGPVQVWNNGTSYNLSPDSSTDWTALTGDYSLRFRYPAGGTLAEQRFDLGAAYPELWCQYWVRVPTNFNYTHPSSQNHKFFAIWMDGYSGNGDGATVIWEFWSDSDGPDIINLAFHHSSGSYTSAGGHGGHTLLIDRTRDLGRWMEITLHVKASTTRTSQDGVIELWRRWQGETPEQRELFHTRDSKVLPMPVEGPQGWKAGYFMGWANGGYTEQNEWLIDNVVFSDESLL